MVANYRSITANARSLPSLYSLGRFTICHDWVSRALESAVTRRTSLDFRKVRVYVLTAITCLDRVAPDLYWPWIRILQ